MSRPTTRIKALGDDFIKLIKFVIAPIIFLTVALGIAGENNAKSVGRVGVKALVYFEVVSTFSLMIGLAVALLIRPGDGFNLDPTAISTHDVQAYVEQSKHQEHRRIPSPTSFPTSIIELVLGKGDILQVLFFAILLRPSCAARFWARPRGLMRDFSEPGISRWYSGSPIW